MTNIRNCFSLISSNLIYILSIKLVLFITLWLENTVYTFSLRTFLDFIMIYPGCSHSIL